MKRILTIFLTLVTLSCAAQIQPTLPAGSKAYGTTTYIGPDGLLWFGTNPLKYRGVYPSTKVDSLFAAIPPLTLQQVTTAGNITDKNLITRKTSGVADAQIQVDGGSTTMAYMRFNPVIGLATIAAINTDKTSALGLTTNMQDPALFLLGGATKGVITVGPSKNLEINRGGGASNTLYPDGRVSGATATSDGEFVTRLGGDARFPQLSGSYVNPSWISSLEYSKITNAPNLGIYELSANKSTSTSLGTSNTLYPSQNAVKTYVDNAIAASPSGTVTSVTSSDANISITNTTTTPVLTLAGTLTANITGTAGSVLNGIYSTGSYADPSWITSLAYSKITGAPSLTGYVPYTGATSDVSLGAYSIYGSEWQLYSNSSMLPTLNIANNSGGGGAQISTGNAIAGAFFNNTTLDDGYTGSFTNSGSGRIAGFSNSGGLVAYIDNVGRGVFNGGLTATNSGMTGSIASFNDGMSEVSYIALDGSFSGNSATSTLAANSTLWNSLAWSGASQPSPTLFLTTAGSAAGYSTISETKTALGIPSGGINLQTVTDGTGNNITNNFLKINGSNNIANGDGLELFWDGSKSNIQSYGRGTSNVTQPLYFYASEYTFQGGNMAVNGYGNFSDGTQGLKIGAYTGGSGYGAIYPSSVTPNSANYALVAEGSATWLNSSASVKLAIGASAILEATSTGVAVTGSTAVTGSVETGSFFRSSAGGKSWDLQGDANNFYIQEAGVNTWLTIAKTTGNSTFLGSTTASSFIKSGGTSAQYLMADGSVSTGSFVTTNTSQGSLSGTKAWTGNHSWTGNVAIEGSNYSLSSDNNTISNFKLTGRSGGFPLKAYMVVNPAGSTDVSPTSTDLPSGFDAFVMYGKRIADGTTHLSWKTRKVASTDIEDYGATIIQNNFTADRNYYLPNVSGTLPTYNTIAPSSATDTGSVGEIRVTSSFIYLCIATNTWVRAAVATW